MVSAFISAGLCFLLIVNVFHYSLDLGRRRFVIVMNAWSMYFARENWKNIMILFLVLLCLGCKAETEQYPILFMSSSNIIAPYGLCSHISREGAQFEFCTKEKDLAMMRAIGADFVRTDFDWGYCQPDKEGPIVFSHHDKMMQVVKNQKVQMLGILSSPNSNDYDKWLKYVAMTARHFKSNVRYWEVINEADRLHLRYPNYKPDDYVRQIRDAYSMIKKNNRRAKVLFTSITDVNGKFLSEVLNAGVSDCFDIMNFHFYVNIKTEPEQLFKYFGKCQEVLQRCNIQKPIWFTEIGCTSAPGYADEETQARRLPRVFLISFACGVEKVFWYKSRAAESSDYFEEHFGIWHKDYLPKPAYYAYKTLARMCPSGSKRPTIIRRGDVYIASWKQPGGKNVKALWTSEKNSFLQLKRIENSVCYDINGREMRIEGTVIQLSPSIIYILGDVEI